MITWEEIWEDLQRVRAEAPLVHNITNYVVMNATANALLAVGASPVMAHAAEEAAEMTGLARALVLNIGTLSPAWVDAMLLAGQEARRKGIPIVLDPVGCGATTYRTATARRLLQETTPTIIRGNASEIMALAGETSGTKGVDSAHAGEAGWASARALAASAGAVVVVSGETDLIVGGDVQTRVDNGHPLMARVTGLGCSATALVAAYAAVNPSPVKAAVHAMAVMGIAGEMAALHAAGPGSFQVLFLDALHGMTAQDISDRLNV